MTPEIRLFVAVHCVLDQRFWCENRFLVTVRLRFLRSGWDPDASFPEASSCHCFYSEVIMPLGSRTSMCGSDGDDGACSVLDAVAAQLDSYL